MDRHENVLGIKYSAPDLVRIQDYLRAPRRAAPDALIGCDSLILCALQTGASGTVSGPAAVFGKRFSGLYAVGGEAIWRRRAPRRSASLRPTGRWRGSRRSPRSRPCSGYWASSSATRAASPCAR